MTQELAETAETRLVRFWEEISVNQETDPEAARREIALRILEADTPSEILAGSDAEHARDYVGKVFAITDVEWRESDKPDAVGNRYALLKCTYADGRDFVMTTGALQIMLQVWRLKDVGALPVHATVCEQEKPSADGNRAMWLELAQSF